MNQFSPTTIDDVLEVSGDAPLGMDKPNTVWSDGCDYVSFRYKETVYAVFLTESDAWEHRARFARFIKRAKYDPAEFSYDYALKCAAEAGISLVIIDGKGNEVCR